MWSNENWFSFIYKHINCHSIDIWTRYYTQWFSPRFQRFVEVLHQSIAPLSTKVDSQFCYWTNPTIGREASQEKAGQSIMKTGIHKNPTQQRITQQTLCTQYGVYQTCHYDDVIMTVVASQITSLMIIYSTVYSGAYQRNIKAPRHWPLCGKFTMDRWISRTNGQ